MTRDTGLRVSLPLVWRGDILMQGDVRLGSVVDMGNDPLLARSRFWGTLYHIGRRRIVAMAPTRAAAEAAVEAAVMKALGERREG